MSGARPPLPGRLIDLYLLGQLLRPLSAALAFVMAALLIERVLRLIDVIAEHGGSVSAVLTMALSLLPHYLGLALPAAFFLSILILMARLAEDSEIDALLTSGLSLRRLTAPFLAIGLLLAVVSLVLSGYVQPKARYAYRAALAELTRSGWTGVVPSGTFVSIGDTITFHARHADRSGRVLSGIFIEERKADGQVITTTAAQGLLPAEAAAKGRLVLLLQSGSQLRIAPDGKARRLQFDALTLDREFPFAKTAFRERGGDERELTLDELWHGMRTGEGPKSRNTLTGELNGRLVQAASVMVLPLLALPMGMAAKRRHRRKGVILAGVIILLYHHILQVGEELVEYGRVSPAIGLWLPFLLLTLFGTLALLGMNRRPGKGPWSNAIDAVGRSLGDTGYYLRRQIGRLR